MSADDRETRRGNRIAELQTTDQQFADAVPSPAISEAIAQNALRLPEIIELALRGYGDRPALGQRAVDLVVDPASGRTSTVVLPRFETITYGELRNRVSAVAAALADDTLRPGDRVCILGFNGVDYTVIDLALMLLGAVCVPLPSGTAIDQLEPTVAAAEPTFIAASVDHLGDAVELVLHGNSVDHLVAFDYRPDVDEQREALGAARTAFADAGRQVYVETLADLNDRAPAAASFAPPSSEPGDRPALLVYAPDGTGAPEGVAYTERMVADQWRKTATAMSGARHVEPSITLNVMPMSDATGRETLYGTLGAGGTAYFAAKSDLSTFLDDLALVRPTQLSAAPQMWEMLVQEFASAVERRLAAGGEEQEVDQAELRRKLLGGRLISARTAGSAPMSADLTPFVESLLDLHLVDSSGSMDPDEMLTKGEVRRSAARERRPYPRAELLIRPAEANPGQ